MAVDKRIPGIQGARQATVDELRAALAHRGGARVLKSVETMLGLIERRRPAPAIELVSGDLEVDGLSPRSPWILVVDGNLRATGDLSFATEPYQMSLLVVTGEVSARHLRFSGSAACYIGGPLVLSGYCLGDHGDEGAELHAERVRARAVLLDATGLDTPHIDAVVCSSKGWRLPMHIDYLRTETHRDIFVSEVLDEEESLDLALAWERAHGGGELFLAGKLEALRDKPSPGATKRRPKNTRKKPGTRQSD